MLRRSCRAARAACHEGLVQISVLKGGETAKALPAAPVDELVRSVRHYFDAAPASGRTGRAATPPDRLVYLLDHQYTQRGLAWSRLKNADAARAAALREVAQQLDCEIGLALADVHETWAYDDDYAGHYGRRRGRNRYYYDDDNEEDELEESPEPELIELIDGGVELRHWVEPGRPPAGMRKYVGGDEGSSLFRSPIDAPHSHNLHASSRIVTCQRVRAALPWPA